MRCICGCGRRAVHEHHVIYAQELVKRAGSVAEAQGWVRDPRNLVPVAFDCHGAHHARQRPLDLWRLPGSVYEFSVEVLGPGAAYEYLRRRYAGGDPRHDALLEAA